MFGIYQDGFDKHESFIEKAKSNRVTQAILLRDPSDWAENRWEETINEGIDYINSFLRGIGYQIKSDRAADQLTDRTRTGYLSKAFRGEDVYSNEFTNRLIGIREILVEIGRNGDVTKKEKMEAVDFFRKYRAELPCFQETDVKTPWD